MSIWIVLAGLAAGLGVFGLVREVLPGRSRLDAALARLDAAGPAGAELPGDGPAARRAARRLGAAAPWLPVPDADLAMLGQDREAWIASKIVCGAVGLAVVPFFTALVLLGGGRLPLALPAAASLAFCTAMFFAPDLVTKVNAAERRADFRHALTSYLDLVALERGRRRADRGAGSRGRNRRRLGIRADRLRPRRGAQGRPCAVGRAGGPGRPDRRQRAVRPG